MPPAPSIVIKLVDDPYTFQGRRDRLDDVLRWMPPELAAVLQRLPARVASQLEEVRLRAGRPLHIRGCGQDWFVTGEGLPTHRAGDAMTVDPALVDRTWQVVCEASVYSREQEAAHGFVTLPGGHRVGVSGRVLVDGGRVLRFQPVAGLNFRIARELPGCADPVIPHLWDRSAGLPYNTLLLSPPGAGKTTLLRDLVRQLSVGVPSLGLPGLRVSLVDERGEVAACHHGVPRRDVGPRTDVLDGCPKAVGTRMAIRSLSPQVVAFDELGGQDDAQAVMEAAHAGVRVIATAHASDPADLAGRPSLKELPLHRLFQRVVVLSRSPVPGTLLYAGPLVNSNGTGPRRAGMAGVSRQ